MYGRNKNEIVFPDLIVGNCLGGQEHTMNTKFAGVKSIGQFGYTTNNFFGGRCTHLYLVKEYGFYACKDKNKNRIIGFYVHDPYSVTELGKKLIREYYPTKLVLFIRKDDIPVTMEDMTEREELIERAVAVGYDRSNVTHMTALQIKDLIKVIEFENKSKEEPKVESKSEPELPKVELPKKTRTRV